MANILREFFGTLCTVFGTFLPLFSTIEFRGRKRYMQKGPIFKGFSPSERSAARLAHQSGGLGVPSSNLGAPTN